MKSSLPRQTLAVGSKYWPVGQASSQVLVAGLRTLLLAQILQSLAPPAMHLVQAELQPEMREELTVIRTTTGACCCCELPIWTVVFAICARRTCASGTGSSAFELMKEIATRAAQALSGCCSKATCAL